MSSLATTDEPPGIGTGSGAALTIVVGIGNPILGDDGIGWRVVEEAERRWAAEPPAATGWTAEPPAATGWAAEPPAATGWAAEPPAAAATQWAAAATQWAATEPPAADANPRVAFLCVALGGLSLMERLVGASRAILVDAVRTGDRPIGTVIEMPLEELVKGVSGHLDNAHDASLPVALAAGRSLGAVLPARITVVGIEAERVEEFGEVLSPPVAAARDVAVEAVLALLRRADGRAG